MKRFIVSTLLLVLLTAVTAVSSFAQCSICTRTAQQLGEKPAEGLNAGILYLALTPFVVIGIIGYRWWKNNSQSL